MRPIRELGLISNEPIDVKGVSVVPRDVFIAAVQPRLSKPGRDLVALRVRVSGTHQSLRLRFRFSCSTITTRSGDQRDDADDRYRWRSPVSRR